MDGEAGDRGSDPPLEGLDHPTHLLSPQPPGAGLEDNRGHGQGVSRMLAPTMSVVPVVENKMIIH